MRFVSGVLAALAALVGCDQHRIDKLEEGVSTEADVRAAFGAPEAVWDEPNGGRTFEYNRNPAGRQNYMITVGPDGKMSALRQVLNPTTFAKIRPGMPMEQVRRMLGKPARRTPYPLKGEEEWEWRWLNGQEAMVFTVYFDRDLHVLRSASASDAAGPS
ncbi:outer membrane protein assembly factor BamE [Ramlibacter humi]|uniref:Outer membrane protein assembly factor BamE n=1 Tax=Ramlibacter humi TaxID=2530451 RepID=A0A4Z0BZ41_9BURK|nr:outer membrane protein assembly factor BamE [Ramlibacter humi]TFZ03952.1 outer membrane protein assembly factor BamE [Ramlibacter humi]